MITLVSQITAGQKHNHTMCENKDDLVSFLNKLYPDVPLSTNESYRKIREKFSGKDVEIKYGS